MIKVVMLIDDEADIRLIGEMSLRRVGGWDVVAVSSGSEALALAAAQPPDLILLDVMMPGLDGPATLARMRQEPALAAVPVIFMTAKVQKRELGRYMELGADGVITKPFDPMRLPQEILRILDEA